MMQISVGLLLLLALAACETYQEPQASCFSFVSRGPSLTDCNFEALGGLEFGDTANE